MDVELKVGDKVAVMVKQQARWFVVMGAGKDEVHVDPMDDYGEDWVIPSGRSVALDMVSVPMKSVVGWRAKET